MENFEKYFEKRKKKLMRFTEVHLNDVGDIKFQENHSDSDPNCWVSSPFSTKKMRELLDHLNNHKIQKVDLLDAE